MVTNAKPKQQLSCFSQHESLKADERRWNALKFVGHQVQREDAGGPREVLELRDCPECHSTLAKLISEGDHSALADETVCTITVSTADAIAIGMQLRAQARARNTPDSARQAMTRVGEQLRSAGMAALVSGTKGRAA